MIRAIFWILASVGILAGGITLNVTDVRAQMPPSPPSFPPIDPSLVECTSFQPAKHPQAEQDCYDTAEDLHQLIELVLVQLAANDFANAIQEALPTTPQMFPDGSVVYGSAGFASIAARWVGSNDFSFISVTAPEFRYRPLDTETVVAYGVVYFTLQDNESGTTRSFASAQTELLRRNSDMPRGWEHIYEQIAYVQPLLGDEP
jgi:hypothetical protein